MLREIRGVDQRQAGRTKRWFQDDYFDLFVWQDRDGDVVEFQLCYDRDTRHERALDWRRGRGFQHLRVRQRYAEALGSEQSGDMSLDGVLHYPTLIEKFGQAATGLAADLTRFLSDKITEYARPNAKFRPRGARTPQWLLRLRRQS